MTDSAQRLEWRCFHCGDVFTDEAAAKDHFGYDMLAEPGCKLNAIEGGLLGIVRRQEEKLDAYHREDTASYREFYSLGSDHSQALRREEEKGYARGLADGLAEAALRSSALPETGERPTTTTFDEVDCKQVTDCGWPECECPKKLKGWFACPICGNETPHHHPEAEVLLRKEALRIYYAGTDHHPVYRRIFIDGGLFVLGLQGAASRASALPETGESDKRPVAFRVVRPDDNPGFSLFHDEELAASEAEMCGGRYEGLYVRDGSPIAALERKAGQS